MAKIYREGCRAVRLGSVNFMDQIRNMYSGLEMTFCVIHVYLFFRITFQMMSKQKYTQQNLIRIAEPSCTDVSGPSDVPCFVRDFLFLILRKSS